MICGKISEVEILPSLTESDREWLKELWVTRPWRV
jgi:hypothetical protein